MPPHPRSDAQHADRQAHILRETRALAGEVGWGAVTMRAVAERSGLSAPSVYEQFAGKDTLLAAVATAGFGELATALRAEAGAGLRGCAQRYWRFAEERPQLYELMFHRPLALPFASAATPAELHDGFAALASHVVTASRDLGITLSDPDTATEAWWSALHGTVSLLLSGRLRPHAEVLLQIATDTFTAGLRAGALGHADNPEGDLMTTSRALADGFATTLSDHDLDAFAALIHDDYVNHNRYAEPGKAGAIAVFARFLDAFEDFRVDVDDVLVDGNTLVGRYTYRGRHTGAFMGVPASGNEIEMHSIDIWRVSDGRLAEHWDELNTLELFQQIGAIPDLA